MSQDQEAVVRPLWAAVREAWLYSLILAAETSHLLDEQPSTLSLYRQVRARVARPKTRPPASPRDHATDRLCGARRLRWLKWASLLTTHTPSPSAPGA